MNYCIANWKMNKTMSESINFLEEFKKKDLQNIKSKIILCPSFTSLKILETHLTGTKIELGAQNVHQNKKGAFTGEISVEIAATLKVARTIWIVPLVIISAWLYRSKNEGFGLPLFVIFFILAALLNSVLEPNQEITNYLKLINRVCLLTGLFCIGTQISIENLKAVRFKPVILATSVWALIIPTSLLVVIGL